jgi:hypothetical protein
MRIAEFGVLSRAIVYRRSCLSAGDDLSYLRRSGEFDRAGHAPWLGHPAQTAATVAGFLR